MAIRWGGGGGGRKTVAPKIPRVVCLSHPCTFRHSSEDRLEGILELWMNYQASNPESLSETPERLSETKTRSGSPAAAAKKRAAEVLTFCTNLSS